MFAWIALSLLVPVLFFGCGSGSDGAAGAPGTPAPATGTISGSVTDAVAADALSGVTVTAATTAGGAAIATATTDASGNYSMSAPIGGCYVNFSRDYYTSPGGMYVGVGGGLTTTVNASMSESSAGAPSVSFAAVAGDNFGYGATVVLAASGNDPNGDTLTYTWSPSPAVTGSESSGTATLPTMAAAFAARAGSGGSDISGYTIPNQFGMLPIYPDTRGTVSASVTVNDGRGKTATATLDLDAASIVPGLRNVPLNTRIYMNRGNDNAAQTWTLAKPAGSNAALDNDTRRSPSFVPDVAGAYTLTAGANSLVIYAGTWEGVITGAVGSNDFTVNATCTICHNGGTVFPMAPDKFTPWKGTGHAKIWTLSVATPPHEARQLCEPCHPGRLPHLTVQEREYCEHCHTVGSDAGASNGGFDDAVDAYDPNWHPPELSYTSWTNMFSSPGLAAIAKLANIQCENCHGPQASSGHMESDLTRQKAFGSPRISFSSEVCAQCHGKASHNIYSQWAVPAVSGTTGHSNRARAIASGPNTSCGRCHSAQGFKKFVEKLEAGSTTLSIEDIAGLNGDNVEPVTCTACHDPHDKTNPEQLRVYGDTEMLPSGFMVAGAGKGALCITCHNTRNGAHDDANAPTSYTAPHTASQGDVFAGRNAYFLGSSLPMVSRHAAVEDACVGCHMVLNPKVRSNGTHKKHLFRVEEADVATLCANCHGSLVNGEGTKAAIEAGLQDLEANIEKAMLDKLNATASVDTGVDNVAGSAITAVQLEESHGQIAFLLTYSGKTVDVQLRNIKVTGGAAVVAANSNLVKAGWNFFLIEGDDSFGIHNPGFAQAVLNASVAQDLSL
jgi:hypothetical protein